MYNIPLKMTLLLFLIPCTSIFSMEKGEELQPAKSPESIEYSPETPHSCGCILPLSHIIEKSPIPSNKLSHEVQSLQDIINTLKPMIIKLDQSSDEVKKQTLCIAIKKQCTQLAILGNKLALEAQEHTNASSKASIETVSIKKLSPEMQNRHRRIPSNTTPVDSSFCLALHQHPNSNHDKVTRRKWGSCPSFDNLILNPSQANPELK